MIVYKSKPDVISESMVIRLRPGEFGYNHLDVLWDFHNKWCFCKYLKRC